MDGSLTPFQTFLTALPQPQNNFTSREVLKVEEEWVKNLEGLEYPPSSP